jgi:hypothetical protein
MRRSDATVLGLLGLVLVAVVFWVLILGPKRSHESDLSDQVSELQTSVSQLEQTAATAAEERRNFPASYHKLVVLGKAVPADSDQSSLLVQLNSLSNRAGVSFDDLELSSDASGSAAVASQVQAPPLLQSGTSTTSTDATGSTSTDSTATSTTSTDTTATTSTTDATATDASSGVPPESTPVAATETAAASSVLGSTVGPAGLPVMPYTLTFSGSFFGVADFLHSLDGLVHTRHGVSVSGRLLTVDGFSLATSESSVSPAGSTAPAAAPAHLDANLAVTTYLTPPDEGVAGGATPAGPPTATAPGTTVPTAAPTTAP